MGHEVFVLPISSVRIQTIKEAPDGIPLLPLGNDPLGHDVINHHYNNIKADCVITFIDPWALDPRVYQSMNWYPITPIEAPISSQLIEVLSEGSCHFPIAISRWGQQLLRELVMWPNVPYLPMIVDDAYIPGDKVEAREAWGLPVESFIAVFVGVNDTNPSRKGIPELLAAWSQIVKSIEVESGQQPFRDALLYLHTATIGNMDIHGIGGGINIVDACKAMELKPEQIKMPLLEQYRCGFPLAKMVQLAQAADVLVIPSRREGACIPLLEFQACNTPVVAMRYHAQREHIFYGKAIRGQDSWAVGGVWEVAAHVNDIVQGILDVASMKKSEKPHEAIERFRLAHMVKHHLTPIIEAIGNNLLGVMMNQKQNDSNGTCNIIPNTPEANEYHKQRRALQQQIKDAPQETVGKQIIIDDEVYRAWFHIDFYNPDTDEFTLSIRMSRKSVAFFADCNLDHEANNQWE